MLFIEVYLRLRICGQEGRWDIPIHHKHIQEDKMNRRSLFKVALGGLATITASCLPIKVGATPPFRKLADIGFDQAVVTNNYFKFRKGDIVFHEDRNTKKVYLKMDGYAVIPLEEMPKLDFRK